MQLTTSAPCRPNTAYTIGGVSWAAKRRIQRKALHRCRSKKQLDVPHKIQYLDSQPNFNYTNGPSGNTISSPAKILNDRYNNNDIIALRMFDGNKVLEQSTSQISLSLHRKGDINGLFGVDKENDPRGENRIGIIYTNNVKGI